MPAVVESRACLKCKTAYRTKVKKGKDTRGCPTCQRVKEPAPSLGDSSMPRVLVEPVG